MPIIKLTDAVALSYKPTTDDVWLWDTVQSGFAARLRGGVKEAEKSECGGALRSLHETYGRVPPGGTSPRPLSNPVERRLVSCSVEAQSGLVNIA